ncbi:hypothetical protein MKW98_031155 [Papaver atlanticum]|uniref:60S acidic ribosomal protein P1 n=1 Tax=Papaver atlanticum TaxID=357466 RepID=A0AAD4SWY1_9MAGN|nr:hypothetical protein MKW98_031155 [Papaver atlanticum]
MSSSGELACTYATLILHDDGIPITVNCNFDKEVQCESYWPGLFAKLAERRNVEDMITNIGATGGGAAAAALSVSASAAVEAPAAEEKKKEEEVESDDDYIMNISD